MKTIEGETISCIPIHKQPAFDHPLLKDHKIQMFYIVENNEENIKYGAGARMTMYNLTVPLDQFSSHNIWIQIGSPDHLSMIVVSWRGDGYRNGCYNVRCPGFVQIDREVTTNYPFYNTSVPGGTKYELQLGVEQKYRLGRIGNWWLIVKDDPPVKVGYWPKEIVTCLRNGSLHAAWGGVGQEASSGFCPQLGSGYCPDSGYDYAAYFRSMYWLNRFSARLQPSEKIQDRNDRNVRKMGYTLSYGGPGGYCRSP
ncbi:hypothetical protein BT93_L5860 [Corymbia citriodora subsp. variegata]|uniref:Neprosin PEP catalytic domain-containing protein n=1 Tax=Corymbia citriodora subsp. variegata TaxID=360336 RepID=A0A8T0CR76_CORYI|nr:hypothetical protein BT93_L5860 [Corymbia citriodora subsp. variegata]